MRNDISKLNKVKESEGELPDVERRPISIGDKFRGIRNGGRLLNIGCILE